MRTLACFLVLACGGAATRADDDDAKANARWLAKAESAKERAGLVAKLRRIGPGQAYRRVVTALNAKNPANRRAAAMLLAEWAQELDKPPGSPTRLALGLKDRDAATRAYLVTALSRYGKKAVAPLLRMLKNRRRDTREAAGQALAAQGPAVLSKVVAMLDDEKPRARRGAMHALGWFDDPGDAVFARLQRGVRARDVEERVAAVHGLRGCKGQRAAALPLLAHALRDRNADVARAAMSAALNHGVGGLKTLAGSLGHGTEAREVAIEQEFVKIGESVAELLVAARAEGEPVHRAAVARVLGGYGRRHGYSVIADALRAGLRDKDASVRLACARSVRILVPDAARLALDDITRATRDSDPGVRAAALLTLERMAPKRSQLVEPVGRAAKQHDPRLRAAAAVAGCRLGTVSAEQALALIQPVATKSHFDRTARADAMLMLAVVPGGTAMLLSLAEQTIGDAEAPIRLRAEAIAAVALAIERRGGGFRDRAARLKKATAIAPAVTRALQWLADRRTAGWRAKALGARHDWDVGVTALATLAFLGAGRTDTPVREGLEFLASKQNKTTGEINQFTNRGWAHTTEHAWATLALCEAVDVMGDPKWRPIAQAAVRYCEEARNPHMAWRYKVKGGENDTHVTTLMTQALCVAKYVGLEVDRKALEGARRWVDKISDPNFGQVGYNFPGGEVFRTPDHDQAGNFPSRRSQSMTAAGILMRIMLGEDSRESEMIRKGAKLCLGLKPRWNPHDGSIDMYFWHFGSLAMWQVGGDRYETWRNACHKALLGHQKADGSWPPAGAWGMFGGQGYSTAIGALTLLAPIRYPRWRDINHLPESMHGIFATLKRATNNDPSPFVRASAQRAVKCIKRSLR